MCVAEMSRRSDDRTMSSSSLAQTPPCAATTNLEVTFQRNGATVHALRGVSFAIDSGEIVAVVGESGSGKSVLGLTLLGLTVDDPRAQVTGRLEVAGTDMLAATPERRRSVRRLYLGAVFQDPMTSLNPTMKIGKQVVEAAGTRPEALRLLDLVGIPRAADRMNAYPHELSGGQRQRVMLAMAVAGDPSLVIADEPTTALDVTVQAQILKLIGALRSEVGCSFVLITHDFGVASQLADRIDVMYGGRILESGHLATWLLILLIPTRLGC